MSYGVTNEGFVKKPLSVIQSETEEALRSAFGSAINLTPQSPLGQIKNILDERIMLLWELSEDIYFSQYPNTANGINLDNVVALTGIARKPSTKSTVEGGRGRGTFGTTIPAGTVISVSGDSDARFLTDVATDIDVAAVDEVQGVDFDAVPDAGAWSIEYDGETTGSLAYNDAAATIQAALEALPNIGSGNVSVTGNYSSGFTITFQSALAGQQINLVTIPAHTLENTSTPVVVTVLETTPGDEPKTGLMTLTAESAGAFSAPIGTLSVIETPVVGLDSFVNETAGDVGSEQETDSELKARRQNELQFAGSGTVNAIRADMLSITDVDAAQVFQNNADVTDAEGRPPHSVDAIVEGGDEQEIADALFEVVCAGITYFGSVSKTVVDDQGFNHTVKFSRPTSVTVYVDLVLVTDADYAGDADVKQAVKDYGDALQIGQDIVVYGTSALICALDNVAGITDAQILLGAAAFPSAGSAVFTASDDSPDLLLTSAGHPLAVGNRVSFTNSGGALPTGLSAATLYFVTFASGNDFKVSASRGGTPVAHVDNGTGTHTVIYGGTDDNLEIGEREKAAFELANISVAS